MSGYPYPYPTGPQAPPRDVYYPPGPPPPPYPTAPPATMAPAYMPPSAPQVIVNPAPVVVQGTVTRPAYVQPAPPVVIRETTVIRQSPTTHNSGFGTGLVAGAVLGMATEAAIDNGHHHRRRRHLRLGHHRHH